MMKPDISIIVPVYNAEKYLRRCIDSILAQTLENFELILVDDGSSDNSGHICDEYAEKDTRIHVIHKQNAGVSSARNTGIAASCGEFIGFVDADDRIASGMFEVLYNSAKTDGYQVVMCDAQTVYSDGKTEADTIVQLSESTELRKEDITPNLLLELAGSAWRCLYSRTMITEHMIAFPDGIKFSEDRVFNIQCFGFADKVKYIKEPYYFRYVNSESAVHKFHADYFESCLKADSAIERALNSAWNGKEEYKTAYLGQLITGALAAICNYYYRTSTMKSQERRAAVKRICQNERIRYAIESCGKSDIYTKMLSHGNINTLILYAKLANIKHGR